MINYLKRVKVAALVGLATIGVLSASCTKEQPAYLLNKEDIRVEVPAAGFALKKGQLLKVSVESLSDEGVNYRWFLDEKLISEAKNLEYLIEKAGTYALSLQAVQGAQEFRYTFQVTVNAEPVPEDNPEDNPEQEPYILVKEDIQVEVPAQGFSVKSGQLLRIPVVSVSDEGVAYQWFLDDLPIADTKELEVMIEEAGQYALRLEATQGALNFKYLFVVVVGFGETPPPSTGATPYITTVFDFMPAVGQFTNTIPRYENGDTQEAMNAKVLKAIGKNVKGMISLGGFGGYVVVGFDHTIPNVAGKRDFRVLGNAFYADSNPGSTPAEGGSCEPGVVVVAYDANKNGVPDDNEWYEIAGSAHQDPTKEPWYAAALGKGNDVKTHRDYQITYHRPTKEPQSDEEKRNYVRWEDNQGNSGYKEKNMYHSQPYYPQWAKGDQLTFKGTRLPQNAINEGDEDAPYYVLYKFRYGYADNEMNAADESAIDIDWAVNSKGQKVNLPGVDFIKIYSGVNQENGWLGECSTEVTGVEDLHLLGINIATR